jgi:SpoVK/Ycf46/Vps4 family AAA+-type ATPase
VLTPRRDLTDLVLPDSARVALGELIDEQERVELLRAHGLEPRHRVLLTGPPGNGKTSVAEAVADALYAPLVRVRYAAVIGSFLGETGARLAKVFEFARTRRCVLLLDEFDAIAKERGDQHETGEIKRVVSSLLLLVDDVPSHVVLIAASNHPELLDRAVHRRFELHLNPVGPDDAQRAEYFDHFLSTIDGQTGFTSHRLADSTDGTSFSQLHDLILDIRRRRVLEPDVTCVDSSNNACDASGKPSFRWCLDLRYCFRQRFQANGQGPQRVGAMSASGTTVIDSSEAVRATHGYELG